MSVVVELAALSHSPFINLLPTPEPGEPGAWFLEAVRRLRERVERFDPDVVVAIGPDHFHANFYDVMPPFTIGAGTASAFGDYGSFAGALPVASELGWAIFGGVTDAGFDPALSLDTVVDHGIVQALSLLWPTEEFPTIVPVIVNAAGPPLPHLSRCLALGAAVGKAVRDFADPARVLVVASGGLSHWIPATDPRDPLMDEARRAALIGGRADRAAFAAAREPLVRALGGSPTARVDEEFDRWFLEAVQSGRWEDIARMTSKQILAEAGNGGQEIRTWLVGLAATDAPVTWTAYQRVPEWLTGMGVATTLPAG